ncbi:hypothetical protein DUZ99_11625 [Xylanibacillus composti]|uniref:Uncharacterized protein n=1 Tax=Xylanibacillus composti TaxID=1572762 RepID=A0A8J4M144_9BACL|nr:hypothetical protein [Xylanibacillus composti]MDT9725622.1 hypothetical protein [Xylanibacillus composti]GIQ67715.1 hypothetical protein XYCOK13_05390 [Xylanibacillus composti]
MIPLMPIDTNDWFVICAALVNVAMLRAVRRYVNWIHGTMIWLFNFTLAVVVDHVIADKPFDFYDVMDSPKVEFMDLFLYFAVYPPPVYLFLILHQHLTQSRHMRVLLIFGFTAAITGLEKLASTAHVFTYNEWKLIYSSPVYLVVLLLNLQFLKWVKKQTNAA